MDDRRSGPCGLLCFVALAACFLASATIAHAQPRTALMGFEGSGAAALRRTVQQALEADDRIAFVDAASEGSDPVAVAQSTGAAIVVRGTVSGRSARRQVELSATDAQGNDIAAEPVEVRTGAAGQRALRAATQNLIGTALTMMQASAPSEETPASTTEVQPAVESNERPPSSGTPREDRPRAASSATTRSGPPLLDIQLVAGPHHRRLGLDIGNTYTNTYWDLGARFDLRPFASSDDALRGLFARGEFVLGSTFSTSLAAGGGSVSTSFYSFSVDVGYLLAFADVFELGLAFGYRHDAFELGQNTVLSGVTYPTLRPALLARLALVGDYLALGFEGGLRLLLSREELGSRFGMTGSALGFDGALRLSGALDMGLSYGLEGAVSVIQHSFSGMGTQGSAASGEDFNVRGVLFVGYALR